MENSKKLHQFLRKYEHYEREILKSTHDEIKDYLKHLEKPTHWNRYAVGSAAADPAPIRMTFTRIKRPETVVDKILRKPADFPDGLSSNSFKKMHDTIGVRILVYFLSQLPLLDRDLRKSESLEISEEKPPVAYLSENLHRRLGLTHIVRKQKESGYSSIHYAVRLTKSSVPKPSRPLFEIQVRTLAQELWSELEHILAYKPETKAHFSARRRFEILSQELSAVDEHFDLLYKELIRNQETVEYEYTDALSFGNLPAVLGQVGVKCTLKDLHDILRILSSRGINTVGDLLEIATPRRLETIRNTYLSSTGHAPSSLELVATLGTMKDTTTVSAEIKFINTQIEYHRSWKAFEKELSPAGPDLHQKS
ncbi:MAG: hypothetical protein BBJ60_10455 [Desulfobacterales bacterium S7086C20]|nr:MAG: hypothetical protein BBJ60_10455 [Desulfobacterales bacterium S7086C20]